MTPLKVCAPLGLVITASFCIFSIEVTNSGLVANVLYVLKAGSVKSHTVIKQALEFQGSFDCIILTNL